jgi:glycosyltransferase involved in cell wall biosynthesis
MLFRLRFIGGSGWMSEEFDELADQLIAAGRDVRVERAVSDDVLEAAYGEASYTVFPSLHEGFGLPVAESLARGRPVVTSRYGATAEVAAGRARLVDPRDDDDLLEALRASLLDPHGVPGAGERTSADDRTAPTESWEEYAERLWNELVEVNA